MEIYAACINDKEFISKIHKEHLQINREKRENPVERRVRKLNKNLTKEFSQWTVNPLKIIL